MVILRGSSLNAIALYFVSFNLIHIIFAVVLIIILYYASVLDLDTVDYFLIFQETRFDQRKIANPLVDFLSSYTASNQHLKIH